MGCFLVPGSGRTRIRKKIRKQNAQFVKKNAKTRDGKMLKHYRAQKQTQAQRAVNARWTLPVHPVFEDEKSKASDKKSVTRINRKNRIKKDRQD